MTRIGPKDFDPYRAEIRDCYCPECRAVSYAASDVLDFDGSRHMAAAQALLASLRAGTHRHVTLAERVAEAKAEKAERLEKAIANGADPEVIAAIERGYTKVSMRDYFATGMGLGIGPRALS